MNRNDLTEEMSCERQVPPALTTVPPHAVPIAEAFAEMKFWSSLKRWTRSGAWGDFKYLRLAYQAYAAKQARRSSADVEFDSLWHSAERAAADHPEREANLARLATKWNLPTEAKTLWKRVTEHAPMRREALDALFRIARTANDLPELLEVTKHRTKARHARACSRRITRALRSSSSPTRRRRNARPEAYDANPDDANCAVTYAYALYSASRTSEGLEVLKKLLPEQLEDPHAAVYMAVLLLDENQTEAAKEYIGDAQKGSLYLEEKKLLKEAMAKAAAAPSPTALRQSLRLSRHLRQILRLLQRRRTHRTSPLRFRDCFLHERRGQWLSCFVESRIRFFQALNFLRRQCRRNSATCSSILRFSFPSSSAPRTRNAFSTALSISSAFNFASVQTRSDMSSKA